MPRAQQLRATPYIFSAEVTGVDRPQANRGATTYTVEVGRIYRGMLAQEVTVTAPATPARCGLPNVQRGTSLMVFAESGEGDALRTASFLGTSQLNPQVRRSVEKAVGAGQLPRGAEANGAAERTLVDEGEPPSMVTAVTPGIGLMALGLLVLLLARVFGRPVRH